MKRKYIKYKGAQRYYRFTASNHLVTLSFIQSFRREPYFIAYVWQEEQGRSDLNFLARMRVFIPHEEQKAKTKMFFCITQMKVVTTAAQRNAEKKIHRLAYQLIDEAFPELKDKGRKERGNIIFPLNCVKEKLEKSPAWPTKKPLTI